MPNENRFFCLGGVGVRPENPISEDAGQQWPDLKGSSMLEKICKIRRIGGGRTGGAALLRLTALTVSARPPRKKPRSVTVQEFLRSL